MKQHLTKRKHPTVGDGVCKRYERLSEASYSAYHELLGIATHLHDRHDLQERVWDEASTTS